MKAERAFVRERERLASARLGGGDRRARGDRELFERVHVEVADPPTFLFGPRCKRESARDRGRAGRERGLARSKVLGVVRSPSDSSSSVTSAAHPAKELTPSVATLEIAAMATEPSPRVRKGASWLPREGKGHRHPRGSTAVRRRKCRARNSPLDAGFRGRTDLTTRFDTAHRSVRADDHVHRDETLRDARAPNKAVEEIGVHRSENVGSFPLHPCLPVFFPFSNDNRCARGREDRGSCRPRSRGRTGRARQAHADRDESHEQRELHLWSPRCADEHVECQNRNRAISRRWCA